jgi:hypothetical protein
MRYGVDPGFGVCERRMRRAEAASAGAGGGRGRGAGRLALANHGRPQTLPAVRLFAEVLAAQPPDDTLSRGVSPPTNRVSGARTSANGRRPRGRAAPGRDGKCCDAVTRRGGGLASICPVGWTSWMRRAGPTTAEPAARRSPADRRRPPG